MKTHRVTNWTGCTEDDGGNDSGKDNRATAPEAVHFKQHASEVRTGQVPGAQGVPVHLTTTPIHSHDVFNKNIQGCRHHRAFRGGRNAKGGFEATQPEDVQGQMDASEVKHDGWEDHGNQAH